MAYSELIKDFERIRDYMRQFYVYGFKTREAYDQKSARSYDNERRRMESWLGNCMRFRRDAGGKSVFISVDSRSVPSNPLYNALKAKSFTAGDISFHFYIMDLLAEGEALSVRQIADAFALSYSTSFAHAAVFDEANLRKKLKEYVALGLLKQQKRGRELIYSRSGDKVKLQEWADALAFFAEEHPLGIFGSQLLDRLGHAPDYFRFKHHYMLQALDSIVLAELLQAMDEQRWVELEVQSGGGVKKHSLLPLRIYVSAQSGRQYVLGFNRRYRKMYAFRLDSIRSMKACGIEADMQLYEERYARFRAHLWGVSAGADYTMDHIGFTLRVEAEEGYIVNRLQREKRCGRVEKIGEGLWRFEAEVHDAMEMLPWIRTFIGRIEDLECSDPAVTERFHGDLEAMAEMYGGEADALS